MCISKNRRKKKNKNLKKNRMSRRKNKSQTDLQYKGMNIPKLRISDIERQSSVELMRKIFEVQSVSGDCHAMFNFIWEYIEDLDDSSITIKADLLGNIYVTKGVAETYPCIVSHIDTVHRIIPQKNYKVLNSDTEFFAVDLENKCNTGIGGDDKNGIYCCLDNLLREKVIKLAFFVDEEIGCVGSTDAEMNFFDDVSFVFQADRQGYEDVVYDIYGVELFDNDFLSKIISTLSSYGRTISDGGLTDVMQLAENGLEVCVANFSCGYYAPHSDYEYVVIDELILTSIMFRDLIRGLYVDGERHLIERNLSQDYYGGWGRSYSNNTYGKGATPVELGSEDCMSSGAKKGELIFEDEQCSYCGQDLVFDNTVGAYYCHGCLDYDYNKS